MSWVDVIIPVYNGEKYLAHTLRGLLAQTFPHWRAWVVDDSSTDSSYQVAKAFLDDPRFTLLQKPNGGISSSRNFGLEHAVMSEFTLFLDQDDILFPDALRRLVEALDAEPGWIGVHGIARYIDGLNQPIFHQLVGYPDIVQIGTHRLKLSQDHAVVIPPKTPLGIDSFVLYSAITSPGSALFRTTAVRFEEGFDGCEDWEMYTRLCKLGPIGHLMTPILMYRWHGENFSLRRDRVEAASIATTESLLVRKHDPFYAQAVQAMIAYGKRIARPSFGLVLREALRGAKRRDIAHMRTWLKRLGRAEMPAFIWPEWPDWVRESDMFDPQLWQYGEEDVALLKSYVPSS